MPGKKRKSVFDVKEVAPYRSKLRKRPSPPPLKLTNKERKKHTFKSPFPQEFSLPSNIIYYVSRNPAFPNGHFKLISTCKFLARMSKILPVKKLEHHYDYGWETHNEVSIQLKNKFFKFWIHDQLSICSNDVQNLASTLVKHVHKCSLRDLTLFDQILTFEEFQILVSGNKLEYVDFNESVVKNADGSITEFEKIFELLCCKRTEIIFPLEQHGVGKNTANKIIEILSSENVQDELVICLYNIPQDFDFSVFSQFLKANMTNMTQKQHCFQLSFTAVLSDTYINQLQQFVNEIIQMRGIYAQTIPMVNFPDENQEARHELWKMRFETDEGILI